MKQFVEYSLEEGTSRIFICYAHKDNESTEPSQRWLDRLLEQLEPLNLQERAEIWSDKQLEIGDEWHEKIQSTLQQVKAAVLLVSPAFLASKYIRNSEVPVLLKQAKERGVKVLPIILRSCLFNETKFKYPDPKNGPEELSLSTLQVANSPTKPLNSMAEHEQDKVLLSVAQRLLRIVNTTVVEQEPESENTSSPIQSVQNLPNNQRRIGGSRTQQLHIESLEAELEKLSKDYRDVDEKKRRESNPQELNNLELQLQAIRNRMAKIEQQVNGLKQKKAGTDTQSTIGSNYIYKILLLTLGFESNFKQLALELLSVENASNLTQKANSYLREIKKEIRCHNKATMWLKNKNFREKLAIEVAKNVLSNQEFSAELTLDEQTKFTYNSYEILNCLFQSFEAFVHKEISSNIKNRLFQHDLELYINAIHIFEKKAEEKFPRKQDQDVLLLIYEYTEKLIEDIS